ncbi:hypothetical protein [Methanobrevibacter sp.]|uniref:hypothetical protein n=1 Tax=Methanobrevibacter sp. TaxID=66852 RepID=UPI0025D2D571|nr:hypothetical protein [Methanobrevibacter sp.]MBR4447015.1 hypothetical protein [Methanobrevibacter sp.]
MICKNLFSGICALTLINESLEDENLKKYKKLKINSKKSIQKSDLPPEFSDLAFKTINEFIKKTANLNFECAIFFDYITGKILKCAFGDAKHVSLHYDETEFIGKHVASIHNHTKTILNPPSEKNFNILLRPFEDYELIAGQDSLWILKAKGTNKYLAEDLNRSALILKGISEKFSKEESREDELYGTMLLNYINNKDITDIQLNKREYTYEK